jgi:hypothetical protein
MRERFGREDGAKFRLNFMNLISMAPSVVRD